MPKEIWHSSLLFSFLLSWSSFPLVSFIVSTSPLWGGLSSMLTPLPREGSAFAAVFASSCLIPWPFFPSCLCGPQPVFSLPFCLAVRRSPSLSSLPAVHWIYHALSGWGRWSLYVLSRTFCGHFIGPPFLKVTFVQQMRTHDSYKLFKSLSDVLTLNITRRGWESNKCNSSAHLEGQLQVEKV